MRARQLVTEVEKLMIQLVEVQYELESKKAKLDKETKENGEKYKKNVVF